METPKLLKWILQMACGDVVERWHSEGVGFLVERPDGMGPRAYLNHICWGL